MSPRPAWRRCQGSGQGVAVAGADPEAADLEGVLDGEGDQLVGVGGHPLIGSVLVGEEEHLVAEAGQPPPRPLIRVVATPPSAEPLDISSSAPDTDLAITPDGKRIVYPVNVNGQRKLVVRAMDELEATPLAEVSAGQLSVDVPRGPFTSPDGNWVG